eukprot:5872783-Pleurochrysis_carterae.AAC.2
MAHTCSFTHAHTEFDILSQARDAPFHKPGMLAQAHEHTHRHSRACAKSQTPMRARTHAPAHKSTVRHNRTRLSAQKSMRMNPHVLKVASQYIQVRSYRPSEEKPLRTRAFVAGGARRSRADTRRDGGADGGRDAGARDATRPRKTELKSRAWSNGQHTEKAETPTRAGDAA